MHNIHILAKVRDFAIATLNLYTVVIRSPALADMLPVSCSLLDTLIIFSIYHELKTPILWDGVSISFVINLIYVDWCIECLLG